MYTFGTAVVKLIHGYQFRDTLLPDVVYKLIDDNRIQGRNTQ